MYVLQQMQENTSEDTIINNSYGSICGVSVVLNIVARDL